MDDLVKKYLQEKYGENYDQKAQDDYKDAQSTNRWANLGSNLGDAIAGNKVGSANGYFQDLNKQAKENTIGKIENDKNSYVKNTMDNAQLKDLMTREEVELAQKDPNNRQSVLARALAKKYNLPVQDTDSYKDVSQFMDPRKMMETEAAANVDFNKQAQLRRMDQGFKEKESALDRNLKKELDHNQLTQKNNEKGEKQKLAMTEINDRYTNMKDSIKSLKSLIDSTSGGDVTGPENKQMDQYITSIATDMAKLVDPQSVARESEVASFKQMLFEPGFLNTMFTRGSTLQSVVDNFESMVDKRLDTAYKVRGLDKPQAIQQAENQSMKGKTVKMKAPDGSVRDVREDQVAAALASGGKLVEMTAGY